MDFDREVEDGGDVEFVMKYNLMMLFIYIWFLDNFFLFFFEKDIMFICVVNIFFIISGCILCWIFWV